MKAVARSYVWWPEIDSQIEQTVKCCDGCQLTQKMPQVAPLHPWEWPSAPWERVHVDFAGPFMDSMFLVLVCPFEVARSCPDENNYIYKDYRSITYDIL
jgi:hypothetical protein